MRARSQAWVSRPSQSDLESIGAAKASRFYVVRETGPTQFVLSRIEEDAAGELSDEQVEIKEMDNLRHPLQSGNASRLQKPVNNLIKTSIGNPHTCSCGAPQGKNANQNAQLCVHILFLLRNVFGVPEDSPLLYQRALIDHEIDGLLRKRMQRRLQAQQKQQAQNTDGEPQNSGGDNLLQQNTLGDEQKSVSTSSKSKRRLIPKHQTEDDDFACSVCYEPMTYTQQNDGFLYFCDGRDIKEPGCGNPIHARCMLVWIRHRQRSQDHASCPLCRAKQGACATEQAITAQLIEANKLFEARRQKNNRRKLRAQNAFWSNGVCRQCNILIPFLESQNSGSSAINVECSVQCILCTKEMLCLSCFFSQRLRLIQSHKAHENLRSAANLSTCTTAPAPCAHNHCYALRLPVLSERASNGEEVKKTQVKVNQVGESTLQLIQKHNHDTLLPYAQGNILRGSALSGLFISSSKNTNERSDALSVTPMNWKLNTTDPNGSGNLLTNPIGKSFPLMLSPSTSDSPNCKTLALGNVSNSAIQDLERRSKKVPDFAFDNVLYKVLNELLSKPENESEHILSTRKHPKWILLGSPALWSTKKTYTKSDFAVFRSQILASKYFKRDGVKRNAQETDACGLDSDDNDEAEEGDLKDEVACNPEFGDSVSSNAVSHEYQSDATDTIFIAQQLKKVHELTRALFASLCTPVSEYSQVQPHCAACSQAPPSHNARFGIVPFAVCGHWLHAKCALAEIAKSGLRTCCPGEHADVLSRHSDKYYLFSGVLSAHTHTKVKRFQSAHPNGQQNDMLMLKHVKGSDNSVRQKNSPFNRLRTANDTLRIGNASQLEISMFKGLKSESQFVEHPVKLAQETHHERRKSTQMLYNGRSLGTLRGSVTNTLAYARKSLSIANNLELNAQGVSLNISADTKTDVEAPKQILDPKFKHGHIVRTPTPVSAFALPLQIGEMELRHSIHRSNAPKGTIFKGRTFKSSVLGLHDDIKADQEHLEGVGVTQVPYSSKRIDPHASNLNLPRVDSQNSRVDSPSSGLAPRILAMLDGEYE